MRAMHETANQLHTGLACVACLALGVVATGCDRRPLDLAAGHVELTDATARTLERGRYLARVTGCNDCHTPGGMFGAPDPARQLSGSELGWRGPWGVTYPRNLSPDRETGLGGWSATQIVTAIRLGVRPDGSAIRPPMPWPTYAALSDGDAYAIAAYLQSIPAVHHVSPVAVGPEAAAPGAPGAPAEASIVAMPPPPAWDVPGAPRGIGGGPPAPAAPLDPNEATR